MVSKKSFQASISWVVVAHCPCFVAAGCVPLDDCDRTVPWDHHDCVDPCREASVHVDGLENGL